MARPKLILEKERPKNGRVATSPRGLVPSTTYGAQDHEYNAYLLELDPTGDGERSRAFRQALAGSSDVRFREFLKRLSEPRYARYHLATIAKTCDLGLTEFADFWQKSQHMRALAKAQDAVVEVTSDMAIDARSKDQPCDRCDGFGWVYAEDVPDAEIAAAAGLRSMGEKKVRTCPNCDGTGKQRKPGDVESRKMLLEMTGHIGKRSAAGGVKIVQNFGGAGIEAATDRMNQVTFDVTAEEVEEEAGNA